MRTKSFDTCGHALDTESSAVLSSRCVSQPDENIWWRGSSSMASQRLETATVKSKVLLLIESCWIPFVIFSPLELLGTLFTPVLVKVCCFFFLSDFSFPLFDDQPHVVIRQTWGQHDAMYGRQLHWWRIKSQVFTGTKSSVVTSSVL